MSRPRWKPQVMHCMDDTAARNNQAWLCQRACLRCRGGGGGQGRDGGGGGGVDATWAEGNLGHSPWEHVRQTAL